MKKIIPIILLAFASSAAVANPELKGTPEELRRFLHPSDRIVSIYAQSEEKAYSDQAIISLVITTEDNKLSDSLSKNSELRVSITKQFVAAGIDLENIKSSKFSTSPQYGWFGKKPSSYKVVNRMAVTITEENQLKEIASVADNHEQVELLDTAFEHSQKEMTEEMVNQQALAKVMKQKEFYEKSLGIKLVPVGFRKSNIGYGATQGAMALESTVLTSRNKSSSYQESPARYESSAKSSFDEVKYEAGIYVDFKIESEAL